jgi:hypothetical protein
VGTSGTTIVNRGYSRTDNLNLTGIADNVTTGNTRQTGTRYYASAGCLVGTRVPRSILGITDMSNNVFELDAFLEDNEQRKPLRVVVSAPSWAEGEDDHVCRVHAPLLFSQDKRIYGADPEQAKSLAIGFVGSLLKDKRVIDANGHPLRW